MRRTAWDVRIDTSFVAVVDCCADRVDTWINPEIRSLYIELHTMGYAHSVEIWDGEQLVGGVYGVELGSAFFWREHVFAATKCVKKWHWRLASTI